METQSMEREYFYKSLRRKVSTWILLVSFTPMILTAVILLYRFNLSYNEKIQAHLSELVQKHTQKIDTFLGERLKNIRFLSRNIPIDENNTKTFLEENLNILKNEYDDVFTDLGLIDDHGVQFAYAGPFKLENASYKDAEWYIEAQKQTYYISDVFIGLRGHPHFIVTAKINKNGANWLLRATINFGTFNEVVESIQIGQTGLAFIINENRQFQTKTSTDIEPDVMTELLYLTKKSKNDTVFIRHKDFSNGEYIYVASVLKNINWTMIFKQNAEDALRDFKRTQTLSILILLLGSMAISALAYLLPRSMTLLISKADHKSEIANKQVVESGKLATIGELAAGIAHEINNPVAIMMEEAGWIEDLLEEEDLKECENLEEFTRALKQIHTQGKRCKEITHKLLSFARKTDATINDVQINHVIKEIIALTEQMARYNNVTIETNLSDGLPYIRISPSEMQQVILNLMNNAIDAMEKNGGVIKIETKVSQLEKEHIVVTVEDTGPGIPDSNLERIFDPFFTTKPVGKGTGLGLSICYGIIRKMGGKIDVQSHLGVGTKFRIWIPFQDTETEE